jgi:hypothetical protein
MLRLHYKKRKPGAQPMDGKGRVAEDCAMLFICNHSQPEASVSCVWFCLFTLRNLFPFPLMGCAPGLKN